MYGLQTCSSSVPCGSLCLSPVIPCGFDKNIDEYEHMNINVEIIWHVYYDIFQLYMYSNLCIQVKNKTKQNF